ncbi:PREDICTED: interleukin-18 [Chrysochloris asiatica]|uniref:Interleukin-18 n=1 Tax=Chrysochloris asiatica TaxID=185453 RepID=A0A9B0WIB4_CHRAS|nr:PREDICTED: interleukin-18 [Chrysochloris asiatica]
MASEPVEDNWINLIQMKFIDNTLYFIPENDEDLESDHFSNIEPSRFAIIRNLRDQVLFIDQGKEPVFEDMPDSDCLDNAPQTIFMIRRYKDSEVRGLAVSMSVKCMQRIYTVSCDNKAINFKEISPPEDINDTKSGIIFFMRHVPGHDKIKFESSLYPGYFLASERAADFYKLTLKKNQSHDTSIMFTVSPQELASLHAGQPKGPGKKRNHLKMFQGFSLDYQADPHGVDMDPSLINSEEQSPVWVFGLWMVSPEEWTYLSKLLLVTCFFPVIFAFSRLIVSLNPCLSSVSHLCLDQFQLFSSSILHKLQASSPFVFDLFI